MINAQHVDLRVMLSHAQFLLSSVVQCPEDFKCSSAAASDQCGEREAAVTGGLNEPGISSPKMPKMGRRSPEFITAICGMDLTCRMMRQLTSGFGRSTLVGIEWNTKCNHRSKSAAFDM